MRQFTLAGLRNRLAVLAGRRPAVPPPPVPAAPQVAAPGGMAEIFGDVYEHGKWGRDDSLSGPGSDLRQTEILRRTLPSLLAELGVRSMLDIPCGDWFWMRHCELGIEQYTGGDVVPWLVEQHRATFGKPGREFRVMDLVHGELPTVDLIFCRDCLVHFSEANIHLALANIRRTGARYLLTTTFPERSQNKDITTGQWRPLNLCQAPFSLPPPLKLINEGCTEENGAWTDKSLGLWPVSAIPA